MIRRISMHLDTWDQLDRQSRELTLGRRVDTGAPLTGQHESDQPDLSMLHNGIPVIPQNSHVALARHRNPPSGSGGVRTTSTIHPPTARRRTRA